MDRLDLGLVQQRRRQERAALKIQAWAQKHMIKRAWEQRQWRKQGRGFDWFVNQANRSNDPSYIDAQLNEYMGIYPNFVNNKRRVDFEEDNYWRELQLDDTIKRIRRRNNY